MNKTPWVLALLTAVLLFVFGWFLSQSALQKAEAIQPTPTPAQGVDANLLQKRFGRVFVPAEATVQPPVTREQALASAYQLTPGLKTATGVNYTLGYLSDPGLIRAAQRGEKVDWRMADSGLVWILSFQGIQSVSSGPPEVKHSVSNELNVVISATTGEELYQFVYR